MGPCGNDNPGVNAPWAAAAPGVFLLGSAAGREDQRDEARGAVTASLRMTAR
jgi:hypothetical protein